MKPKGISIISFPSFFLVVVGRYLFSIPKIQIPNKSFVEWRIKLRLLNYMYNVQMIQIDAST